MFTVLVTQSLRNRLLVLALALVLVVYGAYAVTRLPVDVLPDLNRPTVTIMTEAEGLAPAEVEQLVTFPLETAMNGLPGLVRLRSVSGVGLSVVYVEFDFGTDIFRNRQQIAERLALVRDRLPANVAPQMGPISSIMGQILMFAVTSDTVSPMAVRETADFVIRPRLLAIPGIAQVIPMGGEVRQFRVSPDVSAMRAYGITLDALEKALSQFGTNSGGGFADQGGREFLIRNIARTLSLDDLKTLVLPRPAGGSVFLHQIAQVDYAARLKRGDAGYMGRPAVILSVEKQPEADTLALTNAVEEAVADLNRTLPDGIRISPPVFRQADFIAASIGNVEKVLLEAMAVVAVVLFLFLLNWRTTLISLTAIPVSILATAIVFHAFGLSINTMTLGGLAIAIGELVDDAVVDVENIFRRLRENAAAAVPRPVFDVVVAASREVRSGIVYATLIIVLVFVPLFALPGIEGRLFAPLGQAYIVSILASLLTSITLTPVLAFYLLPALSRHAERDGALVRMLKGGYAALLSTAFRHPRLVMGTTALLFVGALAGAASLPRAFLPPFNEGSLTISMSFRPGLSLAESDRMGLVAETLILDVPEVKAVGRRTGRAELDEHAEGVHASEIEVDLRPSDRSRAEITADIRDRLAVLPASFNLGQPISHRLDHMLSGVRAEIALKLFGDDLDTLRATAESLRQRLGAIPGLVDLQVERQVRVPEVTVSVDYGRAALHGLQPAQVTDALARLSNGRVVSTLVDGNRRFDLVVRLPEARRSAEGLARLLIETPSGWVPLSQVADVKETDGPNQILREGGRRRIVVLANTSGGRDTAAIIADMRRVLAATDLPSGMSTSLEGTFAAQEESMRTIGGLAAVSLLLVFAILYSRYRSALFALVIMGSVPLALIGAVVALWLAGQPLSVASMIGFVTLTGIAARNGILKISHIINLAITEGLPFGPALVARGSLERLTPVLMTAASAGIALLPLMSGAEVPGKEILHPVAVTIFGGLVSATLLDAVLTPVLVLAYGRRPLERLVAAAGETGPTPAAARADAF
ncbi:efflux RND transporter permease subunit [Ancylobacter polymorphus]|jgi:HME family heavy-metal exporter|uniref:Efflux RND transporter permease subunit n=1 Tax=Ancylobacter polymorphus TaxID=223390 RepID=A0A9E6ZV72_9HYPH|nr:efflux RND transporter permease subunit [Ancylobacter polymorphus]UOK72311.1 efflux RND transporter permease subunit [Ancylobacter polymorphus]